MKIPRAITSFCTPNKILKYKKPEKQNLATKNILIDMLKIDNRSDEL